MTRLSPFRFLSAVALVFTLAMLSACGGCGGGDATEERALDEAGEPAATTGETEPGDADSGDATEDEAEAESAGQAEDTKPDDAAAKEAPPPGAPLPRRNVQIYFPSNRDDFLVGEWHEIFLTVTPGDRVKQIIADLLEGSSAGGLRAVPPGTRLRQVYVMNKGVVYLDFTSELTEGLGGGSMRELLTVYSIVDSVVGNIPELHKVGILINGRPIDTLNGHVDLRRPLPPDYSLVRRAKSVERESDDFAAEPRFASTRLGAAVGER